MMSNLYLWLILGACAAFVVYALHRHSTSGQ
jgi:hypothetical protein